MGSIASERAGALSGARGHALGAILSPTCISAGDGCIGYRRTQIRAPTPTRCSRSKRCVRRRAMQPSVG
jgi:hypothetical protein